MLSGSLVALVTPMDRQGEIDFPALRELVAYHLTNGSDGLVVVGTTGESPTLDQDEHLAVVEAVLAQVDGQLPVVVGCGSNNTRRAIALCQQLKRMGVEYGLSVTPYYNKPTQEGLYRHFAAIGEASGLAQILYNVPGRTACDLQPATVARLSHQYGICGIKEATGDLTRLPRLKAACGEDFVLLSGDDVTACDFLLQGGHGVISVTANLAADLMAQLCQLACSGQHAAARALNERLMPLHRALFTEANPIPVKWACARLGLIANANLRLPLTPLGEVGQRQLIEALTQAELFTRA